MNSTEALLQLNCVQENWEETAMELVFEQKQYLLKSGVTPQIFFKRAERLIRIQEACDCLSQSTFTYPEDQDIELPIIVGSTSSLLLFYRAYEALMSKYKLQMMQNLEPGFVGYWIKQLALLEHEKLNNLQSLGVLVPDKDLETVKLSDFVNSGEVIKELKTQKEHDIVRNSLEAVPNLKKDVVRSIKYASFVKH